MPPGCTAGSPAGSLRASTSIGCCCGGGSGAIEFGTGPADPEAPPSCVTGRGGGEVMLGGCLGKAGGAFPPGCLRLDAGKALWWGRLGRLHAHRGRTELGDLASDKGGGLALAVSLLLAVEAAGSVVSVRVVAVGAQPEDGYELAIAIVHLGWPSMLPHERRKLALHFVGSRWC